MTRDAEHAEAIRRCATVAACHAFRASLGDEEMTAQTYAALLARIDALRKWEAVQANPWVSV